MTGTEEEIMFLQHYFQKVYILNIQFNYREVG